MATVMCAKFGKEMPALEKQPFPGEAGKRVLDEVSANAWDEWLNIQTMIINENRLNMMIQMHVNFYQNNVISFYMKVKK